MAVFGVSFYGEDKYGPPQYVDFSVGDVVANPTGFDSVTLTWDSPKGSWDEMRVLRNWTGFPVDENDGQVLLDTTAATSSLTDSAPRPGAWHYYAIFLLSGGVWYRAGIATTLMLKDQGYADLLFSALPMYHQMLQGLIDDLPPLENQTLKDFMSVLGSGLDYIKTYYETLRLLNDPMKNHYGQLAKLAEQFGIEYEPVTPSTLFRSRVQNAGILAREKGTVEQIRSVIGMTVGWNIEAVVGPNLALNEDAASFVHPSYDDYDPNVNYAQGERVNYNGYVYEAKAGGAYGTAQEPSGTNTSNTWWTLINGTADTTLVDADGAVAGWKSTSFTSGVAPGTYSAAIGVGVQSATDSTVSTANALLLTNKATQTADLGVHSTGGSSSDPLKAVQRGIPLPRTGRPWDAERTYHVGDIVSYDLLNYRALTESTNATPSGTTADNAQWACLGVDDRIQSTASLYVKGGTGYQNLLAYPVVEFFDDRGNLVATVDTTVDRSTNVFDGFSTRAGSLSGRATDVGGATWTVQSGGWTVSNGGFVYPTTSTALATVNGVADGQVAMTFDTAAAGSTKSALVFRAASSTSYLKATRTGLYSTSGGVDTLIGSYSTAFSDGDRITVTFTGSNITVLRNGTSVLSASSATNSTATMHGILVS